MARPEDLRTLSPSAPQPVVGQSNRGMRADSPASRDLVRPAKRIRASSLLAKYIEAQTSQHCVIHFLNLTPVQTMAPSFFEFNAGFESNRSPKKSLAQRVNEDAASIADSFMVVCGGVSGVRDNGLLPEDYPRAMAPELADLLIRRKASTTQKFDEGVKKSFHSFAKQDKRKISRAGTGAEVPL